MFQLKKLTEVLSEALFLSWENNNIRLTGTE